MKWENPVLWLVVGLAVRIFLAATVGLGNDEVYYTGYAAYPDWSYFDHPGMLGWLGVLFGGWALPESPLWARALPLLTGTVNSWTLFVLGQALTGRAATGLLSMALYTLGFYTSVVCGVFLMPDAPQTLFWLAALAVWMRCERRGGPRSSTPWVLGVLCAGALASKYHTVFLFAGLAAHALTQPRAPWMRKLILQSSPIALLGGVPTWAWNLHWDSPSFRFHGPRLWPLGPVQLDAFVRELAGEVLYTGPVVFAVIVAGIVAFLRGHVRGVPPSGPHVLLWVALPLWATFLGVSCFRFTLPHWTGPAFATLIPLGAVWLEERTRRVRNRWILAAGGTYLALLAAAWIHVRTGAGSPTAAAGLLRAKEDVTLDVYGWDQLAPQLSEFLRKQDVPPERVLLVSSGWFPTSHIAFWAGRPLGVHVGAIGSLQEVHHFAIWNDRLLRSHPDPFERVYFVNDAHTARWPVDARCFQPDSMPSANFGIYRAGKRVNEIRLYRIEGFDPQRDLASAETALRR